MDFEGPQSWRHALFRNSGFQGSSPPAIEIPLDGRGGEAERLSAQGHATELGLVAIDPSLADPQESGGLLHVEVGFECPDGGAVECSKS